MDEHKTARQIAIETGKCPMCDDCPDGCPIEAPDDSRNARAKFDVTIDGEEWARLLTIEAEFNAWKSGKIGVEEHLALTEENRRLKASVENWKHEAECEHDHVIEFMDINKQLRDDLAASRRREEAAVSDLCMHGSCQSCCNKKDTGCKYGYHIIANLKERTFRCADYKWRGVADTEKEDAE